MIRKVTMLGVAAAVATALSVPTQAVPLPVANVIYISGSTALDNAWKHLMIVSGGSPCAAGTIDTYEDSSKNTIYKKSNGWTIVSCTLATGVTFGAWGPGTNVAFVKESQGGSVEGTTPVSTGAAMKFLDPTVAPAGCAAGVAGTVYSVAHDLAFTDHTGCTGSFASHAPGIGLADENPHVYTIGPNAVNSSIIASLTTKPMFQNMFGVGVSLDLYRALQAQQGLNVSPCTANDDTLKCMPSLNWTTVRTLMSQFLGSGSWTSLIDAATGKNITDAAFNPTGFPAVPTVFVCRRGDVSGTQAAADIWLYNNRCQVTDAEHANPAGMTFSQATTATANCAGLPTGETPQDYGCAWNTTNNLADTTFAGTGTGDVAKCLAAHDAAKQFAIGVIGTNNAFGNVNGAPGVGDYRLVAIDGAHPTVQALANGTYNFAMDNVVNTAAASPQAAKDLQTFMVSKLGSNPVILGDLIVAQVGDANYGVGGLFDATSTVAPPAQPAGLAAVTAAPVSALTQLADGSTLNDCIPPTPTGNVTLGQIAEDKP